MIVNGTIEWIERYQKTMNATEKSNDIQPNWGFDTLSQGLSIPWGGGSGIYRKRAMTWNGWTVDSDLDACSHGFFRSRSKLGFDATLQWDFRSNTYTEKQKHESNQNNTKNKPAIIKIKYGNFLLKWIVIP